LKGDHLHILLRYINSFGRLVEDNGAMSKQSRL